MLPTSVIRAAYRILHRPTPRSIPSDVDYALGVTCSYLSITKEAKLDLNNADILEIGPGTCLAPQLVLASHGARVTLADPFLVEWDPDYHPLFYRAFRERWSGASGALDEAIATASYAGLLVCIHEPVECLPSLRGRSFDLILSNAVLEHTRNPTAACSMLAELSKQSGRHSHQIDYRDHLDRARPLEFLTRTDVSFWMERIRHPSQGNRRRHGEWLKAFESAGLAVESAITCDFAEERYLRDFVPRLRRSASRYNRWPVDDLRILGARINLCLSAGR
jgi:hypothetical protein